MTIYIATAEPMSGDHSHQGLTIYASNEVDAVFRANMIGVEIARTFKTTAHVRIFTVDSAGWRFPAPSVETVVGADGQPIKGYLALEALASIP